MGSSFRTELPLPASSVLEDRLDRLAEEARDLESKRQAGVVLAGLTLPVSSFRSAQRTADEALTR
jgi:hypothetical protein